MTEFEYRSHPAISRSELWRMSESPEKFKYFKDNPEPPTPALLFGQVVHKLILEPETFYTEFAIAPSVDKRTKAGKEEYARFAEVNAGKTIIPADLMETAAPMAAKIRTDPICAALLIGEHEKPYFWTDKHTGEQCKCRVDCITKYDGKKTIIDYKTAESAETRAFNSKLFKYGYHLQAAMYSIGVKTASRLKELPGFIFIVQEKKPPYSLNVISVPDEVIEVGTDVYRELLGKYHSCKETDYWYGYNGPFSDVNEAFVPNWVLGGDNDG